MKGCIYLQGDRPNLPPNLRQQLSEDLFSSLNPKLIAALFQSDEDTASRLYS